MFELGYNLSSGVFCQGTSSCAFVDLRYVTSYDLFILSRKQLLNTSFRRIPGGDVLLSCI